MKAYGAEAGKGFFPYEWFNSLEKLDYPTLPHHAAFFSKLKNENISEEEYHYSLEILETHDMTMMQDFLHWYNDLDVAPFLVAIDNMFSFCKSLGADMFKDAISVPGLTLKYLSIFYPEPHQFLHIIQQEGYQMRQNIVSGPSIIFHRYHEAGMTRIRKGTTECAEVVGKCWTFEAECHVKHALRKEMGINLMGTEGQLKEEIQSLQFEYKCISFTDPSTGKTVHAIRATNVADVITRTVQLLKQCGQLELLL